MGGKIRALQLRQYKAQGADPRLAPQLKALQRIHQDCHQMSCLEAAESWIDREISSLESDLSCSVPELMPSSTSFTWVNGFEKQYNLFMYWWARDQITLLELEHSIPEQPSLVSSLETLASMTSMSSLRKQNASHSIGNSMPSGNSYMTADRRSPRSPQQRRNRSWTYQSL